MNFFSAQVLTVFFYSINVGRTVDPSDYALSETKNVKKPIIPILKHSFEHHKDGYRYSYETGNGIKAQESGYFKHKGAGDEKHEILVQQGSVTYLDEHGKPITLTYIADENGFQPQGAHLPFQPTIPGGYKHEQEEVQEVEYEQQQQVEYEQQPQSYEQQPQSYEQQPQSYEALAQQHYKTD